MNRRRRVMRASAAIGLALLVAGCGLGAAGIAAIAASAAAGVGGTVAAYEEYAPTASPTPAPQASPAAK